jgi:membrane protease subunit HflC
VADYESEGRKRAADILSAAEKEARNIESDARARKQLAEGQADVAADRIRNEAHARDREFYAFLQKLKAYQLLLSDTRDVLLLSTKHPLFDLLLNPPTEPMK